MVAVAACTAALLGIGVERHCCAAEVAHIVNGKCWDPTVAVQGRLGVASRRQRGKKRACARAGGDGLKGS